MTLDSTSICIERIDYKVVSLKLARPFRTSVKAIERRDILVIRTMIRIDGERVAGFGEAAPLPGWSAETLSDCVETLENLPQNVDLSSIFALDALFPAISSLPTLRFGLELAILDALARHKKTSLAALIAEHFGSKPVRLPAAIPVQSTFGHAPTDEICARAQLAFDQGFRCLKLKVGVDSLDKDLAKIAAVHAAAPEMTLRLDANGAWSIDEALRAMAAISLVFSPSVVDLVEQPVAPADFDALLKRAHEFKTPIAPDESCTDYKSTAHLIDTAGLKAIVLKPSTIGGILPSADLIMRARSREVRVVLSTLFESAIARSAIAQLAAAFPALAGPHGLATGAWFTEDLAPRADRIETGQFVLPEGPGIGFRPAVQFDTTPEPQAARAIR